MNLFSKLTLEGLYRAEVEAELEKAPVLPQRPITEQDIARLPAPVQRFFRRSGFIGLPHTANARIVWGAMHLQRAHDAPWLTLASEQVNAVKEPARIALMRGHLAGVLPFEGRDKYQDGHGDMRIKLLKVLTVGDVTGRAMDESGLVTVLSEALFVPSCALQSYMTWQPLDDRSARAELSDGGLTVRGVFHFDEAGDLVRFSTNDRTQDGPVPRKIPWSAHVEGYVEEGGVRRPAVLSATWHEEAGDFTYVRGTIASVQYNVRPGLFRGSRALDAFDHGALVSAARA